MSKQFNIIRTSEDYKSPLMRRLCIDISMGKEIRDYLYANEKKFLKIAERILTMPNMYYDYYGQEYKGTNNIKVSAIKFCDKENTRIYCQELTNKEGQFYIICANIISKKVQQNDKVIIELLENISTYQYEYKP